jgi:nicotinate-nucleotide adenylyltransferase
MYYGNTENAKKYEGVIMSCIGIMGGTFNPVHLGHLIAAELVREQIKLDKIIFIPTGNPPHKSSKTILDSEHRVNMLKIATAENSYFSTSEIEVEREGKTYTYDTLKELHDNYHGDEFYFIIGFDTLKELGTWKNINEICKLCKFIVVNRNNDKNEMQQEALKVKQLFEAEIIIADIPNIELSSTEIRKRICEQNSIRYMVTDEVHAYISENQLYK